MTSEIKAYIEEITVKTRSLHQNLVAERERNSGMTAEISRLNAILAQQEEAMEEMKDELQELQMAQKVKQETHEPSKNDMPDGYIDGLVREIDFCIQQLKIANE
jgi:predicted RNase H-like nuclease (RuvC/YqgF family)